jgi:hypothetical protein
MSGAAVRQLVVIQSRPVSRLRYTQLGVLAHPLTRRIHCDSANNKRTIHIG